MASGNIDWEDDDDLDTDESRGNDVPDLRKAHRALKKQYKEMETQLSAMRQSVRERSVKDVLAAKGINEKVALLIPENVTSAEEVDEWVTQFGDVFGVTPSGDSPPAPDVSPDAAALGRISGAQSTGEALTGDADQMAALIAGASDMEGLNKLLFGDARGPQVV